MTDKSTDNMTPSGRPIMPTKEKAPLNTLGSYLYTLWLFTASDIKSVIVPQTILGAASALSGSLLTSNPTPNLLDILARIPQIALWNWLNLLLFDINNQYQHKSVLEDSLNKPWRVIPSGRLSAAQAKGLLLFVIPSVYLSTLYLGGTFEAVTLMVMTWMYNDLEGSDHIFMRNILNGLGYMCYSSGSMIVATGYGQETLNRRASMWLVCIGAIIFTTLQMQDMPDVKGDAARNRRTVPVIYGDAVARWSIAVPVVFWSLMCPVFWEMDVMGYLAPNFIGSVFVIRLLLWRSVVADGVTWKMWCVWITTIYMLPVWKEPSALIRV